MHNEYCNVFTGIEDFKGKFLLQVKEDTKPYEVSPCSIVYALHKLLWQKLDRLQDQKILAPLGVDETAEWSDSFVIVPKRNVTVWLSLDPSRLNQALIWKVYVGPTRNDILPKLTNVYYMTLIDASSGYQNLKLDTT